MTRVGAVVLAIASIVLGALSVAADGSDDQSAAGQPPWTRSIVCPVLYTHEVPSQATFRRFLTGLVSAGYHPSSLATIDGAMSGTADVPRGCVVLTFDDGLLSQYLNALPVLTDLALPAVFFVLPGFNDGVHRYMGAPELQAVAQAGQEVELHTCNHANLPLLARRNLSAFFAELEDCKHILEDITSQRVDYVAYPYGAFDATVLDAVTRFGFRAAFTTRFSALLPYGSPYTLPRIHYDPGEPLATVLRRIRTAGG